MKKTFISIGIALLLIITAGSWHIANAGYSDGGGSTPAGNCPADKTCGWVDVRNVYDYGVPYSASAQNFYNDGPTADHLCQMQGYENYTSQAVGGRYDKCNTEYDVVWENGAWFGFKCTSSKWLAQIYCAKTAPNTVPTVTWSSTPTSVQCNQSYYVEATGQDSDGNLTAVSVNKDGVPFSYADTNYSAPAPTGGSSGGGSGGSGGGGFEDDDILLNFNDMFRYFGSKLSSLVMPLKVLADNVSSYPSGNTTSDQGPKTVTYTAWSQDSKGNQSNIISRSVTVGSCTNTPPVVNGCTNPGASNYNPSATQDDGSCVLSSNNPEGWLDAASCDSFTGWASDADSANTPIDVHFYADGNFVGATNANVSRPDVGAHGYSFSTPASLKNNAVHSIYAYGINVGGGNNVALSGGGKTIQCAPVPPDVNPDPSGYVAVSPANLPLGGGSVTVSWATADASSCTASGAWSGAKPLAGSESVNVTQTSTFNLSCIGAGGTWNGSATVTVGTLGTTCEDPNASNFGGALPCSYNPPASSCQDPNANNYGNVLPCTYGGGNNGVGFTVTADQDRTGIQFLGTAAATSSPRRIDVNPVGAFSNPVTLVVTDIRGQNGDSVPNGTTITYSFDHKAPSTNSSSLLTYDSSTGRYKGEEGTIGSTFQLASSKPLTQPYKVTIKGISGAVSSVFVLTIDPTPINPNFQEI